MLQNFVLMFFDVNLDVPVFSPKRKCSFISWLCNNHKIYLFVCHNTMLEKNFLFLHCSDVFFWAQSHCYVPELTSFRCFICKFGSWTVKSQTDPKTSLSKVGLFVRTRGKKKLLDVYFCPVKSQEIIDELASILPRWVLLEPRWGITEERVTYSVVYI